MSKRRVKEAKTKASVTPREEATKGISEPIICPICGDTFKDKRGMAGHMAGKHGSKWGLNATVDTLVKEVEGMKQELARVVEAINKRDAIGQRCIELASFIAKKRHPEGVFAACPRTDAEYRQAEEELELLKGLIK